MEVVLGCFMVAVSMVVLAVFVARVVGMWELNPERDARRSYRERQRREQSQRRYNAELERLEREGRVEL